MKWSSNQPVDQPIIGGKRRVWKFAWLPKQMGVAGPIIWLEHYLSLQVFTTWKVPGPGHKGTRTVRAWKEIDAWYR